MAETGRTAQGGYAVREAGQSWVEVDKDTYAAAQLDTIGRIKRAVGGAAAQTGGFLAQQVGAITGNEETSAIGIEAEQRGGQVLEGVGNVSKLQAGLGSAAVLAAEVAVPGGVAGRGARAAARGQRVAADVVGSVPEEAGDALGGSLSAAQRSGPQRTLSGTDLLTAREADNMGMKMTAAERKYLEALESQNEDAVKAAERGLANEDFMRKSQVAGVEVGDIVWQSKDKEEWFTQFVADELGRPDLARLNWTGLREIRDDTQEVFKRAFDEGQYPVQRKNMIDGEQQDVLAASRQVLENTPTPAASVNKAIREIEDAFSGTGRADVAGDVADAADNDRLMQARLNINSNAERAFEAGQYDTGQQLTTIAQILDDAIEAALPELMKQEVQLARYRWKIKKVIERTATTTSKTERGMLNPVSFGNNWRKMTPGYRRHYGQRSSMEKAIDTTTTLAADRAHAGNTLYRAVGPAATTALGAGILGGLSAGF